MDWQGIAKAIEAFNGHGQTGPDPIAQLYAERRKAWGLFSLNLSDKEMEALRPYVFCYRDGIPRRPGEPAPRVRNFIAGEWREPARGEYATMRSPADRRIALFEVPASTQEDVEASVAAGYAYWSSLEWASEVMGYRKWVVKNFARLLHYFSEECLDEIRQQIPKTRLEAEKDFWEGKRAADHLEGSIEAGLRGEIVPPMLPGHTYWRDAYLPAGLAAVITPMNFIYGIPGIQIAGAYLSGCPFVFKGHPFAALTNTTLIRMLIAAGADPLAVQKLEGFGNGIARLATDPRVAVVSVTGSSETAKKIRENRGLGRLRFEGGGCNWAWVDDGYTDEELERIAVRLSYSKLAMSSHKCTGLHGVSAPAATMARLLPMIDREFGRWEVHDPRVDGADKVVGPLMVHKAQTAVDLVESARRGGMRVVRACARVHGAYGENAEAVTPAIITGLTPESAVEVDWDGKGRRRVTLATTELFMPILVAMERDFETFLKFCLLQNPHDLATSIWTRDDRKLQQARRVVGGMLKENDGTDSALEWEEFGASTIGESGNMGVGEVQATLSIFCRRQKGRHVVF